jgi:hypothetical protein
MATRIQVRRGSSSNWTTTNPVLSEGEIGFETDSGKFKIGNGSSSWSALEYFGGEVDLSGYLTLSSASNTYLTQSSASNTYQEKVANISNTEIGYLDNVSSNIQTQIDSKLSSSSASTIYQEKVANVDNTEIGYLNGVTSLIQTQMDSKINRINGSVTTATASSSVVRNITLSTSAPSGGNDGDVWMVYI